MFLDTLTYEGEPKLLACKRITGTLEWFSGYDGRWYLVCRDLFCPGVADMPDLKGTRMLFLSSDFKYHSASKARVFEGPPGTSPYLLSDNEPYTNACMGMIAEPRLTPKQIARRMENPSVREKRKRDVVIRKTITLKCARALLCANKRAFLIENATFALKQAECAKSALPAPKSARLE